jgi:hypothetical protein
MWLYAEFTYIWFMNSFLESSITKTVKKFVNFEDKEKVLYTNLIICFKIHLINNIFYKLIGQGRTGMASCSYDCKRSDQRHNGTCGIKTYFRMMLLQNCLHSWPVFAISNLKKLVKSNNKVKLMVYVI